MRCANCPLFSWWNNENDKGESCGLFGDGWDNQLQYEDKDGSIVGCYVDRHFIEKEDQRRMDALDAEVEWYLKHWNDPFCPSCGEPLYEPEKCVFCGKEIDQKEVKNDG